MATENDDFYKALCLSAELGLESLATMSCLLGLSREYLNTILAKHGLGYMQLSEELWQGAIDHGVFIVHFKE